MTILPDPAPESAQRASSARREVGTTLVFNFLVPSVVALQIAPAHNGRGALDEQLFVTRGDAGVGDDGEPVPVQFAFGPNNTRVHIIEAPVGPVSVNYSATLTPAPDSWAAVTSSSAYDDDVISALRQSRYCPSDLLIPLARAELNEFLGTDGIALAAASWVFERIAYLGGSSGPTDNAVDTLLTRRGVCRDFAHLTITLCRALGVPARLASVYAPGLVQMDFHAVVEVWRNGAWEVLDATRLAPRSSLVRIATGRDAADTSFAATLRGDVELTFAEVYAVVDGRLPADDHEAVTTLAYG